jgi:hypothetical protein
MKSPVWPKQERLSQEFKRFRAIKKMRATIYPGDLIIREIYLRSVISEIARLEDATYAYIYWTTKRAKDENE